MPVTPIPIGFGGIRVPGCPPWPFGPAEIIQTAFPSPGLALRMLTRYLLPHASSFTRGRYGPFHAFLPEV